MSGVSLTQRACCNILFQCDSTAGLLLSLPPPLHIPLINISAFPFLTLVLFLCSSNSHAHYFSWLSQSQACLFNTSEGLHVCNWDTFVIKIKRKIILETTSFQGLFCYMWLPLGGSAVKQHHLFFFFLSQNSCSKAFVGPVYQSVWQNTGKRLGCWFCLSCVAATSTGSHCSHIHVAWAAAPPPSCRKN